MNANAVLQTLPLMVFRVPTLTVTLDPSGAVIFTWTRPSTQLIGFIFDSIRLVSLDAFAMVGFQEVAVPLAPKR
jgi:hypothetical protein